MAKRKQRQDNKASNKSNFLSQWWSGKSLIFRYSLLFLLGIILFYLFYYSSIYIDYFKPVIEGFQLTISAGLLNIMGYGVEKVGTNLTNPDFSVNLSGGCDGMEGTALLVVAILMFPIRMALKVPGLLIGIAVLLLINILRITGLFLTGIHWPSAFDFLHLHAGFAFFMLASILISISWLSWAIKKQGGIFTEVKS